MAQNIRPGLVCPPAQFSSGSLYLILLKHFCLLQRLLVEIVNKNSYYQHSLYIIHKLIPLFFQAP